MRNWKIALGLAFIAIFAHSNMALARNHNPAQPSSPPSDSSNNTPITDAKIPDCMAKDGQPMQINNEEVIRWKQSTANQFRGRGYISGIIRGTTQDRPTHLQLDVEIGAGPASADKADHIEIIYNKDLGAVPNYQVGQSITACGDYITATAQSGPYHASPLGAVIHWLHKSPDLARHPSGFMIINGVLYGQNPSSAN